MALFVMRKTEIKLIITKREKVKEKEKKQKDRSRRIEVEKQRFEITNDFPDNLHTRKGRG